MLESVVNSVDEADAGVIFGTGFAPFRGGPLNYALTLGVQESRSKLEELAIRHGERFIPSAGWNELQT